MSTKGKVKLSEVVTKNLVIFLLIQLFSGLWAGMFSFATIGATQAGIDASLLGYVMSIGTVISMLLRGPTAGLPAAKNKKLILIGVLVLNFFGNAAIVTIGYMGSVEYTIVRIITSVITLLYNIMTISISAMLMDRRAMGTIFAVYTVAQSTISGYVSSWGLKLWQTYGIKYNIIISAAIGVICIILVFMLDFDDPKLASKPMMKPETTAKETPKKKKRLFSGFDMRYMLFCLITNMPAICWSMTMTYNKVVGADRGIDLVPILAISGLVGAVSGFILNTLNDIINPKYVLIFCFTAMGVGALITGQAYTQSAFMIGYLITTVSDNFRNSLKTYTFKTASNNEMPKVQATMYFCVDLFGLLSGLIAGFCVAKFGYEISYNVMAAIPFICVACLILFSKQLTSKLGSAEDAERANRLDAENNANA